jgi:hypothetical protein
MENATSQRELKKCSRWRALVEALMYSRDGDPKGRSAGKPDLDLLLGQVQI